MVTGVNARWVYWQATMWARAVELQYEAWNVARQKEVTEPSNTQAHLDSWILFELRVVTVWRLNLVARAASIALQTSEISEARAAFSRVVPNIQVKELRDTREHFDDYALGKGRLTLGGVSVDVDAWNAAARQLGAALAAATLPTVLAQQEVQAFRF